MHRCDMQRCHKHLPLFHPGYPDVILAYDPALHQKPMVVPFAGIRMQSINANCMVGSTVTDSDIKVREIRTNGSAVIT